MARVLDSLPRGGRVAVVRLRSLGDCVLTTPALELLQRHRPDLQVRVVVEDRFREIFPDTAMEPSIGALRQFAPLLCVNFHGGTRSAWMTAFSGARWRAGFAHYRMRFAYNIAIPRAQEILAVERKVHTAEHLASAMFYLGVPVQEIPRAKVAQASRPVSKQQAGTPALLGVIHAVAATPDKSWPAERFLEVAAHLERNGVTPVFIGGAGDDLSRFERYCAIRGASLSEIAGLLNEASVFVGNDSGPAHMAAAAGLPVVVVFGPSDPEIWGPWRTAGEVVRDPAGIESVPVDRVIQALERVRVHA